MQVIKEILKEVIPCAKDLIRVIGNAEDVSEEYYKDVARVIEKFRYKYLEQMREVKELDCVREENLKTINDEYYARQINNHLYIYIPEVVPFIKGLEYWTNDRIKVNLAKVCRPYKNIFTNKVCIYVRVYANHKFYDIDNKSVKPISDGLIDAGIIKDDNIEKMMYIAEGLYSEKNYTEVYVIDEKTIKKSLQIAFDTS